MFYGDDARGGIQGLQGPFPEFGNRADIYGRKIGPSRENLVEIRIAGVVRRTLERMRRVPGPKGPDRRRGGGASVRYGGSGFDVENASRRTLRLEEAELEFFTGAGSLGRAVLRGSVEVPGRSRGPVCSRWKFDFPDAAAGMVLRKRLEEGDYARLEVEVRMTLRAGAVRRRVSFERMPFSEFLNIFAEDRMRLG